MINLLSPCHLTDIFENVIHKNPNLVIFPWTVWGCFTALPICNMYLCLCFCVWYITFSYYFPLSSLFPTLFFFLMFEIAMDFEYKSCRISTRDRLAKACKLDCSVPLGYTQTGLWTVYLCPHCSASTVHAVHLDWVMWFFSVGSLFSFPLLFIFESLLFLLYFSLSHRFL